LGQVIEERKIRFPDRPLIRISSTFFWHLSSDFELAPLPALAERARSLMADQAEDDEQTYYPMKVGQQVSK
jgi:hypothetical protein